MRLKIDVVMCRGFKVLDILGFIVSKDTDCTLNPQWLLSALPNTSGSYAYSHTYLGDFLESSEIRKILFVYFRNREILEDLKSILLIQYGVPGVAIPSGFCTDKEIKPHELEKHKNLETFIKSALRLHLNIGEEVGELLVLSNGKVYQKQEIPLS